MGVLQPPFAVPLTPSPSPKKRSPWYYRRCVIKPVVETEKVVKNDRKDSTAYVDAGGNFSRENNLEFKATEKWFQLKMVK